MNMLEFVTVKDNILAFLKTHQNDVIDSDIIQNDLKFVFLPNGVVQACIEEMTIDKVLTVRSKDSKAILILAGSGEKLLSDGGYKKKLIEEKKLGSKSDTSETNNNQYKSKKQVLATDNTLSVLSMLSSILFKRVKN
jgi:hypothetical protein